MGQINLAVKGGTTNAVIPATPTDLELVYLEFPVFVALKTPRIMNTAVGRIYGGASLEQRVGCEILVSTPDPQSPQPPPCRTLLKNHDWSWGVGVGLDLVFQGVTTRIDLRRMIGQQNLLLENSTPLRNRATILSGAVMLF